MKILQGWTCWILAPTFYPWFLRGLNSLVSSHNRLLTVKSRKVHGTRLLLGQIMFSRKLRARNLTFVTFFKSFLTRTCLSVSNNVSSSCKIWENCMRHCRIYHSCRLIYNIRILLTFLERKNLIFREGNSKDLHNIFSWLFSLRFYSFIKFREIRVLLREIWYSGKEISKIYIIFSHGCIFHLNSTSFSKFREIIQLLFFFSILC